MKKAILKIEVPKSCKECELWCYCLNNKKLIIYADMRNPDCPLLIVDNSQEWVDRWLEQHGEELYEKLESRRNAQKSNTNKEAKQ